MDGAGLSGSRPMLRDVGVGEPLVRAMAPGSRSGW